MAGIEERGSDSHGRDASGRYLYFAFGSNLSSWRIKINVPSAKLLGVARLSDYALQFKSISGQPFASLWKGGTATIAPKDSASVWGAVWSMDKEHMSALDRQEHCYNAMEVAVVNAVGETLHCRTYMQSNNTPFDPAVDLPSPQYLQCIVDGAKECNLPASYIAELEKIQHNKYSGEVEVRQPPLATNGSSHLDSDRCMYFSFASNMSSWRIRINAPSAVFHKTACLEGYELQFRSSSRTQPFDGEWRGGKANVLRKDGSSVWGAVWSVTREEISAMHRQEPGYDSVEVNVVCADGEVVHCHIYVHPNNPPFDPTVDLPSPQYLQCIIDGAKECNLPASYIAELEKVQHNKYSGEVEVRPTQERS